MSLFEIGMSFIFRLSLVLGFFPQPIWAGVGVHSTPLAKTTDARTHYHQASAASLLYVVFSLLF